MHIPEKQIDYINIKYTSIDESAYKVLLYQSYQSYLYGYDKMPKLISKKDYSPEAKEDIKNILMHNPDFTNEEILVRLMCRFEALFKSTFNHILIT